VNFTRATKLLQAAGVEDAARDVRKLFEHAYAAGGRAPEPQTRDTPNDMTLELFEIALAERFSRKPVAQIIGARAFWDHQFTVTPDVLDPRPDTETLVEAALGGPFRRVLDLGTGSGCILLSLLAARPDAQGLGGDLSEPALGVARANAQRLGLEARAAFVVSDWFADISGGYDLIVSNPPYIAADEMPALAPELRLHEPRMALTDEADGLSAYRIIARDAPAHMLEGARLMVEIGPTQGRAVCQMMEQAGLCDIQVLRDLDARDRVVTACKPARAQGN